MSAVAPALTVPVAGREEPVTEARMLEIVFPDHTNHLGTLFGGQALAWRTRPPSSPPRASPGAP